MGADEEDEGPPNQRRYCTLAPITIRRLGVLAKRGTHGTSIPKVMAAFIEEGVRIAIREGFLKIEDGEGSDG